MGGASGTAVKLPHIKTLLLTAAVVLLAAVVGFGIVVVGFLFNILI